MCDAPGHYPALLDDADQFSPAAIMNGFEDVAAGDLRVANYAAKQPLHPAAAARDRRLVRDEMRRFFPQTTVRWR
jgi:hypothetical protein